MYEINAVLSKENILSKVDSYNLFKYYCPGFNKIGKAFKSPFHEDKHPSAFIIYYEGDLLFKDFGGDSMRAIDFVMRYFNLTFRDALEKINFDFNLGLDGTWSNKDITLFDNIIIPEKEITVIKIKKRDWDEKDLLYWIAFEISRDTLELFNVVPISYFSINDYMIKAAEYAYCYNYYWKDKVFRRKIYQPFSEDKWYSNGGDVVQGEGVLPKEGELLIITSSLKDVMTLYELGYTAIAPTSETSFVPDIYFEKQKSRFKKIIVFLDSDETGLKRSIELYEKWKLPYILIPKEYNKKDISDFNKTYGNKESIQLINNLINEIYIK